ncbi:Adenosine receptor A1 [Triplophysa tibetana]|uniref:Adenosine receptor A1 n=1 Tax=Triplophysa tibetana TaxID=1572043 RepID=A0A5A9NWA4_9TELE|nr:Adenosine receptor A1 [Triplophysa tibetana]
MFAVWRSGALNQSTFCLIVSLAMADFLVGCLAVPLALLEGMKIETSFSSCLFISCVLIVPLQASVLNLLAIAVDRCLRVCIPFRYKSSVNKRHSWSWLLAGVCWMLACLLGFIPMFGWYNHETLKELNSTSFNCEFKAVIPTSYMVNFIFCGVFIPPLVIMIALYSYIFFKIRSLSRGKAGVAESETYTQKEHRLAVSLLLVLVLFVVFWLPLNVMHTINFYSQNTQVSASVMYCGVILSHANSVVNPVVYAFKVPKIRAEFSMIWRQVTGSRQQEDRISRTPEIQTRAGDGNICQVDFNAGK